MFGADDAHKVVHDLLQLVLDGVGVLSAGHGERLQRPCEGIGHVVLIDRRTPSLVLRSIDVLGGVDPRTTTEDEQVGQGVPTEAVGPVQTTGRFPCAEQAVDTHRSSGVRVDLDAAHDVVARRADLHRLLRDVDVGELLELMPHGGQLGLDDIGGQTLGHVEEHATMGGTTTRLDLGVDRSGDLVAGKKLRRTLVVVGIGVPAIGLFFGVGVLVLEHLGDVVEHEPTALGVGQYATVPAHGFGDEESADARRPDHARGVELHELHVDQRSTALQGERVSVPGVLPRVTGDLEGLADSARGNDHGGGLDDHELAARPPVGEHAAHPAVVTLAGHEDLGDRALGEHPDAGLVVSRGLEILLLQCDDLLLQRADHLQTGAVTHMCQTRVLVATEVALTDAPVLRAVEQGSPGFQLPHAVGGFLGVELGHPVVVEELATAHRVAEMHLPVVLRVDVRHGCGDAALGHDRVRLAEEGLAHHGYGLACLAGTDRRTEAGATGADHNDVVRELLVVTHGVSLDQKK